MTGSRRYFERGEILSIKIDDPDDQSATGPIDKYVVVLQGGEYWDWFARPRVLVALITSKPPVQLLPQFAVIDPVESKLRERSYIDCGELHRIKREELAEANRIHVLSDPVMDRVNRALVVGVGAVAPTVPGR